MGTLYGKQNQSWEIKFASGIKRQIFDSPWTNKVADGYCAPAIKSSASASPLLFSSPSNEEQTIQPGSELF